MNSSSLRGDLSAYVSLVWAGRKVILLGTLTCMIVMAVLTWSLPRLYIVRAELDTGPLNNVEPTETNLLVEAVDRNQFIVEGGEFRDTLTDSLTATFRAPSTMLLDARSTDPEGAARRLAVLAAAIETELKTRFKRARVLRSEPEQRAASLLKDVNARTENLARVFEARRVASTAVADAARAAVSRIASERVALHASAKARFESRLRQARAGANRGVTEAVMQMEAVLMQDPEANSPDTVSNALEREQVRQRALERFMSAVGSAFGDLPGVLRQMTSHDVQLVSALEVQRAVVPIEQRDARAVQLLAETPPAVEVGTATRLQGVLDEIEKSYLTANEPQILAAVKETTAVLVKVEEAYRDLKLAADAPLLVREPALVTPPAVPASPAWPQPLVNLGIAFLFGLAGSTLIAVFTASRREEPAIS